MLRRTEAGNIPRVIARRGFRLVGMLLLLVHHDETEIITGGKHRRARTHHNAGVAALDAFPLVHPFADRERAVQHRHPTSVFTQEYRHHLRCQRYLRHQHDDLLAILQHPINEIHIHRRLAAAGHAVQQRCGRFIRHIERLERIVGTLLLVAEHRRRDDGRLLHLFIGGAQHLRIVYLG